ncbi:hypothetical protein P7L79_12695 [Tistrella mobilis]|uniref:hypothetical protein n=1 Tax=Tistrella mobilis TaxID=171437 RepID=UPI003558D954
MTADPIEGLPSQATKLLVALELRIARTLQEAGKTCGAVAALARASELAATLPEVNIHEHTYTSAKIVACWAPAAEEEGVNPLELLQVRTVTDKLIWLTSAPMMVRTVGGGERGAALAAMAYWALKEMVVPHWTDRDGEPLEYAVTHYRAMTPAELAAWEGGR